MAFSHYYKLSSNYREIVIIYIKCDFFSLTQNRSERMEFLFEFLFSPLPTSALVFLFGLCAVALTYLNTRPKPLRPPVDLNRQTVGIAVRDFLLSCGQTLHIMYNN